MTSTPNESARWQAFAVCVGVAALTILDLSKVNVGLPSMERSLGAGSSQLQLIVAGYALAFGLALVPAGRLGDIHSRKLLFVVGLSAFTISSLLCAVAPSIEFLLVARTIQGVAAGIQMPQVLGLIQQLFRGEERARAFGIFGATVGVATAFGPTVGGLLIAIGGETDGWRLLFWMNIPLGLAAIYFAVRLLPKRDSTASVRTELDIVGIVLLGLTTLSLMFPFVFTTGTPEQLSERWLWLIGVPVFGALFALWERSYERKGKSPVVHFSLFRIPSYRNGVLLSTVYFAAIPAMFLVTTLFLQQGLGLEPVYAGMVSIPFALGSAVTAWFGSKYVTRLGRNLVVAGLVLAIVGFSFGALAVHFVTDAAVPFVMAAALLISGLGGGLVTAPNQTLMLSEVSVDEGGVAGSIGQLGQRVGTALGIAIATAAFFTTIDRDRAQSVSLAESYGDGYVSGFFVCAALIAVALALAIADLARSKGTSGSSRATA
jgi:MFS family permease